MRVTFPEGNSTHPPPVKGLSVTDRFGNPEAIVDITHGTSAGLGFFALMLIPIRNGINWTLAVSWAHRVLHCDHIT